MKNKTISKLLIENAKRDYVSFRSPGHKGRLDQFELAGYEGIYGDVIKSDVTELIAEEDRETLKACIEETKLNYAAMYGSKHTELLINSCDAGIIAAILAAVPRGGKLILGRNCGQAAFNALRLGGIEPIYIRPEIDDKYGIQSCITKEEVAAACDSYPDTSAVLISSPNRYGMLSDIRGIANVAHDRNMILIVDQSHGAHLSFFDMEYETYGREASSYRPRRQAAENLGADIVIDGISETLFSMSSSGLLNVCSDRVDSNCVTERLKDIQPEISSYVMLASLDINENIMRRWGIEITHAWKRDIEWFYGKAGTIDGLALAYSEKLMDYTKLNLSMAKYGLDGEMLAAELSKRDIFVEMAHGDYVLLVTGAGNRRGDYEKLAQALHEISEMYSVGNEALVTPTSFEAFDMGVTAVPTSRDAVPLYRADGRVVYSPIVIYPPGLPVACPGEIMNTEVINYIAKAVQHGDKITGVDEEGCIYVGSEL